MNGNEDMPILRTRPNAVKEIKMIDPNSIVTLNFINNLIRDNKIKVIKSGNRNYVNVKEIVAYINTPISMEEEITSYKIRKC